MAGGALLLALMFGAGWMVYNYSMTPRVDPTVYTPLLNTIAKGESNGNYNAHYGNASNSSIRFTDMTVGQVLAWQDEFVRQGNPSSAVGKYQIIQPTLSGLVQKLGIDLNEKYDEGMQDRLAIALLERRGALEYATNKLSRQQFAANLAMEWAALPKIIGSNPEQSYYAGDGLNKVQVSIAEVYRALDNIQS
jgi:conjugal transfer mating pair stabilization protein TraG